MNFRTYNSRFVFGESKFKYYECLLKVIIFCSCEHTVYVTLKCLESEHNFHEIIENSMRIK